MGKTKTIEVRLKSLKTTATPDDSWFENHQKVFGTGLDVHPNYKYLEGDDSYIKMWFTYMGVDWKKQTDKLDELLKDIKKNGINDQIRIYRDGRINTGHKRACIALFLGYEFIRVEVVPDDFKL